MPNIPKLLHISNPHAVEEEIKTTNKSDDSLVEVNNIMDSNPQPNLLAYARLESENAQEPILNAIITYYQAA